MGFYADLGEWVLDCDQCGDVYGTCELQSETEARRDLCESAKIDGWDDQGDWAWVCAECADR
jgi:hypothetical protein